jgi:ABC-type uncharacterized transport system involved in gliding motility auxiliary subunit
MKRLVDLLSPLGLVLAVGSTAWLRAGKTLPGEHRYYLYAALFLVVLHAALRFEDIVKAVGQRQMKYGSNTLAMVLGCLGLLAAVNYIAARNSKRWDLTKNQRYSLSDQSKKLVAALEEDVKVLYFQRKERMPEGRDRLQQFERASSHIKTEFIDPVQQPARAREYDVSAVPTVVLERGAKREKISNDSEQDITNALIKVTRDTKKTVCFASGEGQADIDDFSEQGYSAAKSALSKSQYETKKVVLLQEGKIPEDCTVVAVPGPQKDLMPGVVSLLRDYVAKGGRLLVMVEPEMKGIGPFPNLTGLLEEWNIETSKDVVLDVSLQSQLAGTGPLMPLAAQYPYHEITKDFRLATAFQTARSVKAGSATTPGLRSQALVETSPQSWAESDLLLREPVQFDDAKDVRGPISLAAVATLQEPEPAPSPSPSPSPSAAPEDEPKKPEGRVVAVGDADFASNAFLGFPGNQDLFVNSVAWLAEDADLISIRPREADDQRLFLTAEQHRLAFLVSLVGLPGLFVVAGIWNWWRRR